MKYYVMFLFISIVAQAQTIYVSPDVDIKTIPPAQKQNLYAQQLLQQVELRGVREEIMNYSQMFLQNQMSANEFEKALWSWSQAGWSEEERWVLIDTLKKSSVRNDYKTNWICRLDPEESCTTDTILSHKLPEALRGFEGLILDGKSIQSVSWDGIKISQSLYNWSFVSSKYKSYQFRGTWKELQKQNPVVEPLVSGSCSQPQILSELQNLSSQIYYSSDCIRPSLRPVAEEKGFYEKNKKAIWWGVGLAIGAGVASTFKGKSIVIDKPGFM